MPFSTHWKGHLLMFDRRPRRAYADRSGRRLLLIVLVAEGIVGPRLGLLRWVGLPLPPLLPRYAVLIAVVLALATRFAGVRPAQLGLHSWTAWSPIEKSFFVQVFFIAALVFGSVYSQPLLALATTSSLWSAATVGAVTSLLWGFYQELIYRGLLQTELVRRWGPLAGVVTANALYTFGPLHYNYLAEGTRAAGLMLAAIFAIGLYFGAVFERSGNLWLVGIFHGIGNWYAVGLPALVGSASHD